MGNSSGVEVSNLWSDIFEIIFSLIGFFLCGFIGYFLLSDKRIKNQNFVVVPYKRFHLLGGGVAFTLQALFAMFMVIGFESILQMLSLNEGFNFINGIIIRDYRWVSITLVTTVLAVLMAAYQALPQLATLGFSAPVLVWGLLDFHVAHASTAEQFYVPYFVAVGVVVALMLLLWGESRSNFIWRSLDILMIIFFFGSILTDHVILGLSNPYTNEDNAIFGSTVPQWVYWTTKVAAIYVITFIGWLNYGRREPASGNLSDLYPHYDAMPFVVKALLRAGVIAWDPKMLKFRVVRGNLYFQNTETEEEGRLTRSPQEQGMNAYHTNPGVYGEQMQPPASNTVYQESQEKTQGAYAMGQFSGLPSGHY